LDSEHDAREAVGRVVLGQGEIMARRSDDWQEAAVVALALENLYAGAHLVKRVL
jgi:hypothetical protein